MPLHGNINSWIFQNNSPAIFGGFSAEYQAVYDSFTTKPSAAVAAAQNTMVKSLVDGGVWAKLDVFDLFAQEANGDGEALKNWINPGTFDATLVNAPAFVSLEGFTGNGTSSYINSNFKPLTDGVKYLKDDACVFAYQRTDSADSGYLLGSWDAGDAGSNNSMHILPYATANGAGRFRMNDSSAEDFTQDLDNDGFYYMERSAANARAIFSNDVSLAADARVSTGRPKFDLYLLARNDADTPAAGRFSVAQISVMGLGGRLLPAEKTALQNAIETYMDSNGKGVIT